MAASRVNASVEQANVSSGWDESKPEQALKVVNLPKLPHLIHDRQRRPLQTLFTDLKKRGERLVQDAGRYLDSLRHERPGYLVAAAAAIGLVCGVLLRKRRLKSYEPRNPAWQRTKSQRRNFRN